jgi:thymidine phosphorylase
VNENIKKIAMGGSAIVLAIAMGLQTFIFGQNDIQTLKNDMVNLSERIAKLEAPKVHE